MYMYRKYSMRGLVEWQIKYKAKLNAVFHTRPQPKYILHFLYITCKLCFKWFVISHSMRWTQNNMHINKPCKAIVNDFYCSSSFTFISEFISRWYRVNNQEKWGNCAKLYLVHRFYITRPFIRVECVKLISK